MWDDYISCNLQNWKTNLDKLLTRWDIYYLVVNNFGAGEDHSITITQLVITFTWQFTNRVSSVFSCPYFVWKLDLVLWMNTSLYAPSQPVFFIQPLQPSRNFLCLSTFHLTSLCLLLELSSEPHYKSLFRITGFDEQILHEYLHKTCDGTSTIMFLLIFRRYLILTQHPSLLILHLKEENYGCSKTANISVH